SSSLDATDAESRARAAAVELLNLELELVRPWVAAGNLVAVVRSPTHPDVSGALFHYHRTHLLVPLWSGSGAQYVPGQAADKRVKFVVPGVPKTNRVYEIVPGGLPPVEHPERIAGGVQVTLGEFSLCSMVLFAEDHKIVDEIRQRAREMGPHAARLYRQLAARKLHVVEDVEQRVTSRGAGRWQMGEHVSSVRKYLQSCDGAIAAHDYKAACLNADRAMRLLRIVERSNWLLAVRSLRSPVASPATVCFSTLPWHWSMVDETRSWRMGTNLAAGGDFESISAVMAAGWKHFQHTTPNLEANGEIVARAAHSGQAGLRLIIKPATPDEAPTLVETPPIWVTSPAVYVEAGTLVRIDSWVHIPTPLTGSVDGLKVFDSLTGDALAERIGETTDWQPLTLYRTVPRSGPMSVTFALCGLGEVWIDDVSIQVISPAGAPVVQHPMVPGHRF
ncbi:MAG: hypothetical protein JW888_06530, partial [Pirellulales bacterium]|nr:hypothetical protein [Pirellulales bacterium]